MGLSKLAVNALYRLCYGALDSRGIEAELAIIVDHKRLAVVPIGHRVVTAPMNVLRVSLRRVTLGNAPKEAAKHVDVEVQVEKEANNIQ